METNRPATAKELENYAAEVLDPNKVILTCERHNFRPDLRNQLPKPGCEGCAKAYFIYEFASTPPHRREELIEKWERAIKDACALEDRGKFDFRVHRPVIERATE